MRVDIYVYIENMISGSSQVIKWDIFTLLMYSLLISYTDWKIFSYAIKMHNKFYKLIIRFGFISIKIKKIYIVFSKDVEITIYVSVVSVVINVV